MCSASSAEKLRSPSPSDRSSSPSCPAVRLLWRIVKDMPDPSSISWGPEESTGTSNWTFASTKSREPDGQKSSHEPYGQKAGEKNSIVDIDSAPSSSTSRCQKALKRTTHSDDSSSSRPLKRKRSKSRRRYYSQEELQKWDEYRRRSKSSKMKSKGIKRR